MFDGRRPGWLSSPGRTRPKDVLPRMDEIPYLLDDGVNEIRHFDGLEMLDQLFVLGALPAH